MSNDCTPSRGDQRLMRGMRILFANHSNLLSFVFDSDKARLRRSAEELLSESMCFSSGEQVLIRLAINLWADIPCAGVSSIFGSLDWEDFSQVLKTLVFLGPKPPSAPPRAWRQLKMDSQ